MRRPPPSAAAHLPSCVARACVASGAAAATMVDGCCPPRCEQAPALAPSQPGPSHCCAPAYVPTPTPRASATATTMRRGGCPRRAPRTRATRTAPAGGPCPSKVLTAGVAGGEAGGRGPGAGLWGVEARALRAHPPSPPLCASAASEGRPSGRSGAPASLKQATPVGPAPTAAACAAPARHPRARREAHPQSVRIPAGALA
jgi:hypothetical protein